MRGLTGAGAAGLVGGSLVVVIFFLAVEAEVVFLAIFKNKIE